MHLVIYCYNRNIRETTVARWMRKRNMGREKTNVNVLRLKIAR